MDTGPAVWSTAARELLRPEEASNPVSVRSAVLNPMVHAIGIGLPELHLVSSERVEGPVGRHEVRIDRQTLSGVADCGHALASVPERSAFVARKCHRPSAKPTS